MRGDLRRRKLRWPRSSFAALLEVRKDQEVTLDEVTLDEVTRAGHRADLAVDRDPDKILVSAFEEFCKTHRDELDALQVLYSRPYAQRLPRKQLMELVAAIQRPPRQWSTAELWAAYERREQGRVRGASRGRLMTDLISLARHALGVDTVDLAVRMDDFDELPFAERGGLGKVWSLFGDELETIVNELNQAVVA